MTMRTWMTAALAVAVAVGTAAAGKPAADKTDRAAEKAARKAANQAAVKPDAAPTGKAASAGKAAAVGAKPRKAKRWPEGAMSVAAMPDQFEAARLAIADLASTFGTRYPDAGAWLSQWGGITAAWSNAPAGAAGDAARAEAATRFADLRDDALLANPLLQGLRLLVIRRSDGSPNLGLPQNWTGNCALPRGGFSNDLAVLERAAPDGELRTIYRPERDVMLADVDLHFDGTRLLFSMPDPKDRIWHVWEMGTDGQGLRQVTPDLGKDVDQYDACYLPDGRILFDSTAPFAGVPCVGGGSRVANLYLMDAAGTGIRQLGFDQEHNWCPTVMNDGRVMYSRWEYTDTPHYFTRLLFQMNPDGTGQRALYGSNSWWPNSIFYARPIPGSPTRFVAVISGHHGVPRMGELVLFDAARGTQEAGGAVQRIPGRGKKVEPVIQDGLVQNSWPKFVHPFPLAEPGTLAGAGRYFLVSMQPDSSSPWGIYLADTFDNLVLVREEPGFALMEPVPLRPTARPPSMPDRVNLAAREATVQLGDVYLGEGMRGVPRGTVKSLRIYSYHYAYPHTGGHIHIGIDGPWDARRILGTVPVEADGSASFTVPANTPIAVQPLDAQGRAVQIMRSWFTAMPGERLSCVGCHEYPSETAAAQGGVAFQRAPSPIAPWRGPERPYSFRREVQPVLDRNCVGCHNGADPSRPDFRENRPGPSPFRNFTPSYVALHPYVNRPGPESDYRVRPPMEYHAETSELVQLLRKGHHGVRLDAEAWDRLITWIDLNVPDFGTWTEQAGARAEPGRVRRIEMAAKFANQSADPEAYPMPTNPPPAFVAPPAPPAHPAAPAVADWPFDAASAKQRAVAAGLPPSFKVDPGNGSPIEMVLVPAGSFVMGDPSGFDDESPACVVKVDRPFYLSKYEVRNADFAAFDPAHESGYISEFNKDHSTRGQDATRPLQPAIRVPWAQAAAFCDWLSKRAGRAFTLPTEAQWEWACRAGTATAMNYGDAAADFGRLANLADARLAALTVRDSPSWIPRINAVNDGAAVTDQAGRYPPNAWGLCDMHGNAAEWTRSLYRPYPYREDDGRNDPAAGGARVVRGGSFMDRPAWARSAVRMPLEPWGRYPDVGFRVACEASAAPQVAAGGR